MNLVRKDWSLWKEGLESLEGKATAGIKCKDSGQQKKEAKLLDWGLEGTAGGSKATSAARVEKE